MQNETLKQLRKANGKIIDQYGDVWYSKDGNLHREDGPAIEWKDGGKAWYLNGKRHREDGPAIEYADGNKAWYINGKLHREDGPAYEYVDGDKFWYLNGICVSMKEVLNTHKKLENYLLNETLKQL